MWANGTLPILHRKLKNNLSGMPAAGRKHGANTRQQPADSKQQLCALIEEFNIFNDRYYCPFEDKLNPFSFNLEILQFSLS